MAFHRWLNSTSDALPTLEAMSGRDVQMLDTPPSLAPHSFVGPIVHPSAVRSSPKGYENYKIADGKLGARSGEKMFDLNAGPLLTGNQNSRPHPTMRLSHVEQAAEVDMQTMQHHPDNDSRRKYHFAMQHSTGVQWSQQVSQTFVPRSARSRDRAAGGRPSLAATHPANYGPPPSPNLAPPTPALSTFEEFLEQMESATPPHRSTSPPHPLSPQSSSREPQLRLDAHPMWHISAEPNYWGDNFGVLRSDTSLEPGNVVSAMHMIGLPCGSMIEAAHHYPSKEALENMVVDA